MGRSQRRPRALVPVTVALPLHLEALRYFDSDDDDDDKFVKIHVSIARAVWHILRPVIFESNVALARRVAWLLLLRINNEIYPRSIRNEMDCGSSGSADPLGDALAEEQTTVLSRQVLLPWSKRTLIIIMPPLVTQYDASQEQRLIHFENQLIRAQSMAGFLSTLGGGFFMCHHWRTAVSMARQQQQMARVLGDSNMYFKCLVNQAYNFIYAGKFQSAKALLRQVVVGVQAERPSEAQVLINMVASAMLFRKRVKMFARQQQQMPKIITHGEKETQDPTHANRTLGSRSSLGTNTMDDYKRIRVVKDESSADDIIRAFHGRAM